MKEIQDIKVNVVLDQSLSKTRQSEINGGSSHYPQALIKAMQSTTMAGLNKTKITSIKQ